MQIIGDVETDGLPSVELYETLRERYWVLTYDGRAQGWLLSPQRPIDVPNGMMTWRRPTYGEVCDMIARTRAGLPDRSADLAKYRRSDPAPPLCECGHGEDAHRSGGLLIGHPYCRSTCPCVSGFQIAPTS